MKYDLLLGGVGGQGILSISFVIDHSALKLGLHFKQAEVHGMAQRGGAVSSHLRLSDAPIWSDLVPLGGADLVLSVEPMEALRYLEYLRPGGKLISSITPVENIADYPPLEKVLGVLLAAPGVVLVDSERIAKAAGSHRAQNMVLLGAAAPELPIAPPVLEEFIRVLFEPKGEKLVATNTRAFQYGRAAGLFFRACLDQPGVDPFALLELQGHLNPATLDPAAAPAFALLLVSSRGAELRDHFTREPKLLLEGTTVQAERICADGLSALRGGTP